MDIEDDIIVLQTIELSLSRTEREAIDRIIEKVRKHEKEIRNDNSK